MDKKYIFFVFGVILLTFLSLSKALSFEFWRDDWGDTWGALYHGKEFITTWAAARLHPGSGYEKYFLTQIFQTNSYPWQVTGLVLRILSALSVSFMVYGMTSSRRIACIAGLLFAPLSVGLESYVWISAHTSGIFIIPFCFGVYLWTISLKSGKKLLTAVAIFILMLSFSVSPARGIIMLALLPLWDILSFIVSPSKSLGKHIVIRNVIFIACIFLVFNKLNSGNTFPTSSLTHKLTDAFKNTNLLINLLASIGNAAVGWVIRVPESGSLAYPNLPSVSGGILLTLFTIYAGIGFIVKRNLLFQMLFFSCLWMFLFYLPNWFYDQGLTLGTSHRYLTISSVGLVVIFAYLFALLKQKWSLLFVGLFILLNIYSSHSILLEQSMYRSKSAVDPLWDKINADVPQEEKGSIFMYGGDDSLRGNALDWSFSIPFVLKRKFALQEDSPIATGDINLIQQLICQDNVSRPAIGRWVRQKRRIPLSHLHAWNLSSGIFTDISVQKREEIKKTLPCVSS